MHYQNEQRKKFKIKFQVLLKFAQIPSEDAIGGWKLSALIEGLVPTTMQSFYNAYYYNTAFDITRSCCGSHFLPWNFTMKLIIGK